MAATVLSVHNLSQRFITDLVFSGVSFQVGERERIALVGTNGSGKSSLLRIVAGLTQPADGTVDIAAGTRVAYQAQEASFTSNRSLYDEALDAFLEVREIGRRMGEIEQQMASSSAAKLDELFVEYSTLSTEFEARHGYDMEHRTAQVLSGLGFPEEMFDTPVNQLSGGQKTRVSLAKTLLSDPDLLLLDEPTNHLDLQAIEWLEDFLQSWNRSFLVVSHDRFFLDKVTNRTLEMAFGSMEDYPASYVRYLKLREERYARRQKEYEEQQAYIARTEEFIRKYKAGQRSREARGRETRLARLERIAEPQEHQRLNVRMHANQKSGEIVLRTEPLTIGYPTDAHGNPEPTVLAQTGELVVQRGDRVAIIGPNGAGKTTALRTIVGEISALKGGIEFGTNVKVAYYAQGHERLDPRKTAMDTILADQPLGEEAARNLLGRFLFTGDDAFKLVSELSGGERSRLALARLSLERANFLILDEPTNHLDIPARESLEEVLLSYDGTLVFVSHDRYFIDRIASRVWAIEDDQLETYLGNYTDMMHHRALTQTPAQQPVRSAPEPNQERKPARSDSSRASQRALDKQLRASQKRLSAAERSVSRLEGRLNKLSDEIAAATAAQDVDRLATLGTEYDDVQRELESAYAEWSAAGSAHDELETEASVLPGNGS